MPSGQRVPNFGFVVFESDAAVQECLKKTPIHLPDGHRLNVETKKNNKVSNSTQTAKVKINEYSNYAVVPV